MTFLGINYTFSLYIFRLFHKSIYLHLYQIFLLIEILGNVRTFFFRKYYYISPSSSKFPHRYRGIEDTSPLPSGPTTGPVLTGRRSQGSPARLTTSWWTPEPSSRTPGLPEPGRTRKRLRTTGRWPQWWIFYTEHKIQPF